MYSAFDKSVTAVIMAIIVLANQLGLHLGWTETDVTAWVTALTPILVYLVPNLPKDKT